MKLYRSKGTIWTGTQPDAKKAQGGTDYELVEVPTSKPELIAWLNANIVPKTTTSETFASSNEAAIEAWAAVEQITDKASVERHIARAQKHLESLNDDEDDVLC